MAGSLIIDNAFSSSDISGSTTGVKLKLVLTVLTVGTVHVDRGVARGRPGGLALPP